MLGVKAKKTPSSNANEPSSQLIFTGSSKVQPDLLDKVLKCMNILMDIAAQTNRNVIIDQVN